MRHDMGDVDPNTLRMFAAPRSGVIATAALWLAGAVYLARLAPGEAFLPWIWPVIYAATGASVLAVLMWPWSTRVHLTTTALGLMSLLLRPAALAARVFEADPSIHVDEATFRSIIYVLAAFLWFRFCEASLNAWRMAETVRRITEAQYR